MLAVTIIVYIFLCLTLIALVEYVFHRWFMHKRPFNSFIYFLWPFLLNTFDKHAIQHHNLKRHDINVDLPVWWALLLGSPFWVGTWFYDPILSVTFLTISILYAIIWTVVHRYSHGLPGTYKVEWWYPLLGITVKHHLNHHKNPGRNFGTVFIITDRLFGTKYEE